MKGAWKGKTMKLHAETSEIDVLEPFLWEKTMEVYTCTPHNMPHAPSADLFPNKPAPTSLSTPFHSGADVA